MFSSVEDLDRVVKLIFFIILLFFPNRWHSKIFPACTLCYVKGHLPWAASGELDLANLNQMNWGQLPIDSLWPQILNNPEVNNMLLDHCSEFEYEQILWISEFDPLNRAILLINDQCMKQINWIKLDLEDYIKYFPELEIENIFDLKNVREDVIIHGLSKINYSFSNSRAHCEFIERLPVSFLQNSKVLKNSMALNLFNVNCFLSAKRQHLIKPFTKFLFKMQFSSNEPIWKFHLLELEDFLKTTQINDDELLKNCQIALESVKSIDLNPYFSPNFEFINALETRNFDYISLFDPKILETDFDLGPFDQYRLILIILGRRNLDIFIKFFEANLFEDWVIRKYLKDNPEVTYWLYNTEDITNFTFLRLITLHPPENILAMKPFRVLKASQIKDSHQLLESLRLLIPNRFLSQNFRIELADEVTIDLGGPLLDWITRILQLFLDLRLFSSPINYEADAQAFIDPELFKFLGLLHGKLLQIGSGPCWIPAIKDDFIQNVSKLLKMQNNPNEALEIFNDFDFSPFTSIQKAKDFTDLSNILVKLEKCFHSWKILAWENYFIGLRHFFIENVPHNFIKKLLIPSEPPSITGLLTLSKIEANDQIPHNLSNLWEQIIKSFSVHEILKLLLFITGQYRPVHIIIFFSITNETRLPQARTCFNHLLMYCPQNLLDFQSLTDWLTQSLKMSIENYEGFGNI